MRKKSRLTITLPKDLLARIDKTIDGSITRNRSHAIETLIQKSIKNPLESAIILAGGALPGKNPTLKLINGKPLILTILQQLSEAGITKVFVCAGADNTIIKKMLGNYTQTSIKLFYISEPKPLGTGGIVKKAAAKITEDSFLVVHGDVLAEVNLRALIEFHTKENTFATIAVKPRKNKGLLGNVLIEGNQITHFFESNNGKGIAIINTGVYILKKLLITRIKTGLSKIETDILPLIAKDGQLTAFIFQGFWQDISDHKDYQIAKKTWPHK